MPAEMVLWKLLRDRRLGGFKFRRQHPIGSYVVDFACAGGKLVIELDGETHLRRAQADAERSAYLEAEGWLVMRF